MSEELHNCQMWRETDRAKDTIQVHVFANKFEAQGMAKYYREHECSARVTSRDIKVAGCRVRVWCLVRR